MHPPGTYGHCLGLRRWHPVLIDTGSGNSALRHGAMLNMLAEHFELLLLTHRHLDHMGGLPFLQGQRTLVNPEASPIKVYSTEESLS